MRCTIPTIYRQNNGLVELFGNGFSGCPTCCAGPPGACGAPTSRTSKPDRGVERCDHVLVEKRAVPTRLRRCAFAVTRNARRSRSERRIRSFPALNRPESDVISINRVVIGRRALWGCASVMIFFDGGRGVDRANVRRRLQSGLKTIGKCLILLIFSALTTLAETSPALSRPQ